jgi:hypothetical protein
MKRLVCYTFLCFLFFQCAVSQPLTWQITTAPVSSAHYSAIAVDNAGRIFAGIGGGGAYRSTDDGTNWTQLAGGLPADAIINTLAVGSGGLVFAGAYTGTYRSTNNGDSWTSVNNSETRSLIIAADGSVIACTVGGVLRSTNNGDVWSSSVLNNIGIKSFALKSDGKLFAAGGAVYLSTDNGATWTPTTAGPVAPAALTITPNGNVFAGGVGISLSTDNGTTWTTINNGLLNPPMIKALASNSGGHVFAATIMGVYRSTDNGAQWSLSGVPYYLYSIVVAPNGFVYAGTESNGLFKTTTATTGVEDHYAQPNSFTLNQNYPNPFNPSTTITYQLTKSGRIRLTVLNVLGQEVATLVHEEQSAGSHSVSWNASGIASGVYFYQLESEAQTVVKKLVLLR